MPKLKAARKLPSEILAIIETLKQGHPMDVLRTAVSALAAFERGQHPTIPSRRRATRASASPRRCR